jgi:hypothetical protein
MTGSKAHGRNTVTNIYNDIQEKMCGVLSKEEYPPITQKSLPSLKEVINSSGARKFMHIFAESSSTACLAESRRSSRTIKGFYSKY